MRRRIPLCVALACVLATSAWAQLASQTALVGTVTDSGGLALPRAPVVAVNLGTQDTYEATTNAEGYYNIQFVRPGRYEITVTMTGFQTVQGDRRRGRHQPGGAHERHAAGRRRSAKSVTSRRRRRCSTPTAPTVSATINERAIVELPLERPQRLEPGGHDARRPGRSQQRHRPELPGRRAARDPEQPLARRHQRHRQPAGGDQHAADRGRGDRDPGPDRQHVRRVRRLPRRPRQRGDQERHQQPARLRSSTSSRTSRSTSAATSTTRRSRRIRATASSSAAQLDGPIVIPGLYNGRNKTFFMVAYEGVRGEAIASPIASVPTALMRQGNFSEITTPIRDPFTGQPFPGNIIPPSMLDPTFARPAAVLPGGQPGRAPPTTTRARAPLHGQRRSVPRPRRPQPRQQGAAEPPLQLARQLRRATR